MSKWIVVKYTVNMAQDGILLFDRLLIVRCFTMDFNNTHLTLDDLGAMLLSWGCFWCFILFSFYLLFEFLVSVFKISSCSEGWEVFSFGEPVWATRHGMGHYLLLVHCRKLLLKVWIVIQSIKVLHQTPISFHGTIISKIDSEKINASSQKLW